MTEDSDKLVSIEIRLRRVARHRLGQHFVDGLIEPRHSRDIGVAEALVEPQNGSAKCAELCEHLARGESLLNAPLGMEASGGRHQVRHAVALCLFRLLIGALLGPQILRDRRQHVFGVVTQISSVMCDVGGSSVRANALN